MVLSCGLWGLNRGPHVLKDHGERKELGQYVEPGSRELAWHMLGPGFDPQHILPIKRDLVWPHVQGWVSFVHILTMSLSVLATSIPAKIGEKQNTRPRKSPIGGLCLF